jgi:hypothetical protein
VPPDAARLLLLAEKLPDYPSLESPDHTVLRS